MIRRLLFLSAAAAAAAFIAPAPLRVARPASAPPRRPPSPLGAADDEAAAADAAAADAAAAPEVAADDGGTDDADAAAAAADILNSPAFLKRKVEVLRADVASLEEEIAAVNATYLAGKEEWGGKFDMLDKEVSASGREGRPSPSGDRKVIFGHALFRRAAEAAQAHQNQAGLHIRVRSSHGNVFSLRCCVKLPCFQRHWTCALERKVFAFE